MECLGKKDRALVRRIGKYRIEKNQLLIASAFDQNRMLWPPVLQVCRELGFLETCHKHVIISSRAVRAHTPQTTEKRKGKHNTKMKQKTDKYVRHDKWKRERRT